MHSITLDAALNLLWVGISIFALALFRRCDWKRRVAVFLATVALFPIVSDSDDLFSFSLLRVPLPHHRNAGNTPEDSREKDTIQLARLIETLDHYQPAAFFEFAPSVGYAAVSVAPRCASGTRSVLPSSGRAPPAA